MEKIRIAIAGVGNCASALAQGIRYYRDAAPEDAIGLMHWAIAGYRPFDIEVVAAFDIDRRKVGRDFAEAVFAAPNCVRVFAADLPESGTLVTRGPILDGFSEHLRDYPEDETFLPVEGPDPSRAEIVRVLRDSGAEMLLNYLPVGSEAATRFYADCALEAGIGFVNNIPVMIASDAGYAARFAEKRLPLIGDDIMSQLGATITHRALAELFTSRGLALDRTYQLNTGGNTDFLNMLNRTRLASKKVSKTEAVQSVTSRRLAPRDIHVGPSDYVPWQRDNKVCFMRLEGRGFGDAPIDIEVRMSVQDSPNSAGVGIDAIRCVKVALQREQGGVLYGPSSYFCKHPPRPASTNDAARRATEDFLAGEA